MLRMIWMIVEGLLAAIGVFTIGINVLLFRKSVKDPKTRDIAIDLVNKLCGEK